MPHCNLVRIPKQVPYRVLSFLTSYINYGGRVTDYIDLRTIDVIMRNFYTARVGQTTKKPSKFQAAIWGVFRKSMITLTLPVTTLGFTAFRSPSSILGGENHSATKESTGKQATI